MREDLLQEVESELALVSMQNEKEELLRREKIRKEYPDIYELIQQREELIFGTLRNILKGSAETSGLPEKMFKLSIINFA